MSCLFGGGELRWVRRQQELEGVRRKGPFSLQNSPQVLPWHPPAPQRWSWCKGRGDGDVQLGLLQDTTHSLAAAIKSNQILALSLKNPGLQ